MRWWISMLHFIRRRGLAKRLAALEPCPLPVPLDLSKARKVMVFAPHPDDETLGCGGTLALLARQCAVKVVLVTDGSGAGGLPEGAAAMRQQEFGRALAVLGVHDWECLQQPDGGFEGSPDLQARVMDLMRSFQPNWVFMPSPLDYHRDHARIAAFVEALCRRVASVDLMLCFEIWAPVPATHVVDITDVHGVKQSALLEHRTALAHGDYLRAVEGLNRYRGLYLGKDRLAEAFFADPVVRPGLFPIVQLLALDLLDRVGGLRRASGSGA